MPCPKRWIIDLLLPADNSSSGFDNIADLLFVSPTTMERYLDAAEKISRLAVGDPAAPVMVNRYRLSDEQPQDARVDGLPFGTRGGLAVQSDFPVDGEYLVKVELAGAAREPHQLEISVDGETLQLHDDWGAPAAGAEAGAERAAKPTEFRIPVKAGPHLIGVTFIERNEVRDEETLRPRMRGRGTQPAIASRHDQRTVRCRRSWRDSQPPAHFRLPSGFRGRRTAVRETDPLYTLRAARTGGRSRRDLERPAAVLHGGRAEAGFDPGIRTGARTDAGQPAVPVPHRARSGQHRAGNRISHQRSGTGLAPLVLPVEQHSGRRAA